MNGGDLERVLVGYIQLHEIDGIYNSKLIFNLWLRVVSTNNSSVMFGVK